MVEHLAAELAGQPQVERELELVPLALEVLVQLPPRLVGRPRRAEHPRAEGPRELLLLALGFGVVGDLAEAAIGHGHEQPPDGRVDQVVGDVEQPFGGRGVAEACVKLGRDRHESSFFRSRRTPEDAACLAASEDEPSAAPMSS